MPDGGRARRWVALTAILAFGVGVPFVLSLTTHSISIPHNDSWSYSKAAEIFARTGQIQLQNWNRSALVGQLVLLGPLGRWIWVQQTAVAVLGVVGLLLTFRILARRLAPGTALLGTALVAVLPGYGLISTSFMDAIPAFTAAVGCIAVADVAIERQSPALLAAALAIGFVGFTIREEVLAALIPAVAAALSVWRHRHVLTVVSMAAVLVAAMAAFEIWRTHLPDADRPVIRFYLHDALNGAARSYFTLALFLLPAVLASGVLRRPSRLGVALAVPAGVIGWATVSRFGSLTFLGNYLGSSGAYATADIGVRVLFPSAVMDIVLVAALVSGILFPAVVVMTWRALDPMLAALGILAFLGVVGECLAGELVYDRDLLVLVLPAAVLCLRAPARRPEPWVSAVPLAGLAALSLLLCANALARDGAIWGSADRLVARGVPATGIDAGLDWVAYHSPTPVVRGQPENPAELGFWDQLFPDFRSCFAITVSPLPGRRPVERVTYSTYAVAGTSVLDVYRLGSCATTAGSARRGTAPASGPPGLPG